jgi:hypothetical protein
MEIVVEISEYERRKGIAFEWDPGWDLRASRDDNGVKIGGTAEALHGLAAVLLTLAQDAVRPGAHVHLDSFHGLSDESEEVLLERF